MIKCSVKSITKRNNISSIKSLLILRHSKLKNPSARLVGCVYPIANAKNALKRICSFVLSRLYVCFAPSHALRRSRADTPRSLTLMAFPGSCVETLGRFSGKLFFIEFIGAIFLCRANRVDPRFNEIATPARQLFKSDFFNISNAPCICIRIFRS